MLSLLNDGRDVENMLETAHGFNFGQFKDALDVTKAAMMGHSFGGATAVQTLSEDSRFVWVHESCVDFFYNHTSVHEANEHACRLGRLVCRILPS